MINIDLSLTGENAWRDLEGKTCMTIEDGDNVKIAGVPSPHPHIECGVAIRIDLPSQISQLSIIANLSLSQFLSIAEALKAHYGDPRIQDTIENTSHLTLIRNGDQQPLPRNTDQPQPGWAPGL